MPIEISLSADGQVSITSEFDKYNAPVELTTEEEQAVNMLFSILNDGLDEKANLHLERHSENYLSVVVCSTYDFCRLKIGVRSKWFSLFVSPVDRRGNDERLNCVKQKNLLHWKIPLISVEDISSYSDIIKRACDNAIKISSENS